MNPEEHKVKHQLLNKELDELVADCITHTKHSPSTMTVIELMEWSYLQTENPTESKE